MESEPEDFISQKFACKTFLDLISLKLDDEIILHSENRRGALGSHA